MSHGAFSLAVGAIGLATFAVSVFLPERRNVIFSFGGGLIAALGLASGKYGETQMWGAINLPVLTLILALLVFSELLRATGVLESLSTVVEKRYADPAPVQILLLLAMYLFSMFINNLAAVLVLVPLILRLGVAFPFDMKRFLVALVIASNLGGASTIIGDFPNMIISRYAEASAIDYLIFLGLPVSGLALCSFYLLHRPHLNRISSEAKRPDCAAEIRLLKRVSITSPVSVQWNKVALWFLCFLSMLIVLSSVTKIDTAFVAMGGAVILLVVLRAKDEELGSIDLSVLVFFASLFIIVGGLRASGLFDLVSRLMLAQTRNPYYLALGLMYFAAFVTAFFSAGPSTACLIDIAISLQHAIPGSIVWWALSLGVLAGSSGTLIGATAGPVMASLYQRERNETFTFVYFSRFGIPAMLMYLALGSLYIAMLLWLS